MYMAWRTMCSYNKINNFEVPSSPLELNTSTGYGSSMEDTGGSPRGVICDMCLVDGSGKSSDTIVECLVNDSGKSLDTVGPSGGKECGRCAGSLSCGATRKGYLGDGIDRPSDTVVLYQADGSGKPSDTVSATGEVPRSSVPGMEADSSPEVSSCPVPQGATPVGDAVDKSDCSSDAAMDVQVTITEGQVTGLMDKYYANYDKPLPAVCPVPI